MTGIKIHKVRNPFMCRLGQFEEGKQSLCIGVDVKALRDGAVFSCQLGNNSNVTYRIESVEALRLADEKHSFWTNPKGRQVAILPLAAFSKE